MAELIDVVNSMFRNRNNWINIADEDKDKYLFIINRYLSKKYPLYAYMINKKNIDKCISMDMWFEFMKDKPYPIWFWSKSPFKREKSEIVEKDLKLLFKCLSLDKKEDLDYLIINHLDIIKEELKFYKKNKN